MLRRWIPAVAAVAALLITAAIVATPLHAQEIPRLTGPVTDLANAVDSTSEIEDAIDELQRERGVQLFVLYVETTGDRSMASFTDDVREQNNLGASDALFVVAVEDQTYQLWLGDLAADDISQEEQDTLLADDVEPELRNGDFAGAAVATADSINSAISGDITDGGGGGGPNWGLILIVLVVLAGVVFGAYWLFATWRGDRRSAEERDRRTGELARKANATLLSTDDALRDAEQELGFAEAEFTPPEVAPFRTALDQARAHVKEAFAIRQKLDDHTPETPPQREAMLKEIISRCEQARQLVDAEKQRLDLARDLERRAPDVLKELPAQIEATEQALPAADANLAQLQQYAEASWRTVQGNIVEAQKRIEFAKTQSTHGADALARDDRKAAAAAVRAAQSSLGDASGLLGAIGTLADSMKEAQAKLSAQLPVAERDIRSARVALTGAAPELAAQVDQAEQNLAEAQRLSGGSRPDVLAAYQRAVQAEALADAVLRTTQEAEETRRREAGLARAAIASAESSYRRASDFVLSRRNGGIGREARTRLAEAERYLDQARSLVESHPRDATDQAQKAQRLADDALQRGQQDFGTWGKPDRGGMGDLGLGMVLGGILFGGGGGGGFGGTRWGSPGRGGGGFSFPGGGGGGRSRGGRW